MKRDKPIMNGADVRLSRLQVELEAAMADLASVIEGMANAQIATRLEGIKVRLETMVEAIRTARTLAHPQSWRFQMGYDAAFCREFIRGIDGEILARAVAESEESDLEKFAAAIEERITR